MTAQKSLVTIDASEPIGKINEIIARDGGVIVSNFLSSELMQECLEASKYESTLPARSSLIQRQSSHTLMGAVCTLRLPRIRSSERISSHQARSAYTWVIESTGNTFEC